MIGVERLPAAGETVLGGDLAVHPGGKGANQAVAAARLGAATALLARVGDDGHGRLLLDSLRAAGVDTVGVLVGGAPTGVALITVDPSGDNSIVVSPGAIPPAAGGRPGGAHWSTPYSDRRVFIRSSASFGSGNRPRPSASS
ncbi:Ribokinase [Streptomyces canarius]